MKPTLHEAIPSCWSEDIFAVYDEAVATAPPHSILIECGSFWGKSAVYLAEAARTADKDLSVFCIDLWDMRPHNNPSLFDKSQSNGHIEPRIHAEHHDSLFETFAHFVDASGLSPNPLRIMRMNSLDAAMLFYDHPDVHFVYLDDDHEYEHVLKELTLWSPCVRSGGIIAGHDATEEFSGVMRAVHEYFDPMRKRVDLQGKSWIVRGLHT